MTLAYGKIQAYNKQILFTNELIADVKVSLRITNNDTEPAELMVAIRFEKDEITIFKTNTYASGMSTVIDNIVLKQYESIIALSSVREAVHYIVNLIQ